MLSVSPSSVYPRLKGDILGLGKVWLNLYVCGIGFFSYLTYVHFWHHMIKAAVRKRKSEMVQSDIVGYYPRSKLPFHRICLNK